VSIYANYFADTLTLQIKSIPQTNFTCHPSAERMADCTGWWPHLTFRMECVDIYFMIPVFVSLKLVLLQQHRRSNKRKE